MQERSGRVLGAPRSLADALASSSSTSPASSKDLVRRALSTSVESLTLEELEGALLFSANNNSNYVDAGKDDFHVLIDEVLNNSIRSVLVFDEQSSCFGDAEIASLATALQHNLSVEALTLNGINVSDESIGILSESIVHSRISFLDLSNSPLEDDAGMSIAALAHINPYLRTVVLDDTLISDDVLDEIDVACQFNQSNFEGNRNCIDESLFSGGALARLKRRMQFFIRCRAKKVHFCVAHLFGCCPNGELCLYSHNLNHCGGDDDDANGSSGGGLSAKIRQLFATGGKWEERLPLKPQEGASWRSPDEGAAPRLRLRPLQPTTTGKKAEKTTARNTRLGGAHVAVVLVSCAVCISIATLVIKRVRMG